MKTTHLIPTLLMSALPMATAATYDNLSTPLCDEANKVISDGNGNFAVRSSADTSLELTLDLNSMLNYANSNDYKSGIPLLLLDANLADYGITDVADTKLPTGERVPAITAYWAGQIWPNSGRIEYETLKKYADGKGKVTLRIAAGSTAGMKITAIAPNGGEDTLYSAPKLRAAGNKTIQAYRVNLNYATALTLHTPSTLDTANYTAPADYTKPFVSKRGQDGLSLGRVMLMGDSITHGVNDCTWRWQLFKILVDNGVEAEIVGPRSGYTPGYTRLTTRDAGESYGGVSFPNVHLAQSSGRTHNIISGSNAGMTGVNYGGHSTAGSADSYNCDTWCCLMGTNDLLSDKGYTPAAFAEKMQRMLGGEVSHSGKGYKWQPGSTFGNMGQIAKDVLRDKGDVLYVMSVPCWGRHHNNNEADRHETVSKFNPLLRRWVEAFSKKSGLDLRYVEVNKGMVDPTAATPFTWPDSMSNRPGVDGLHPNEQGSLIMAGNLARTMGIGGRTAGLPRASADTWEGGKTSLVKAGTEQTVAKNALTQENGYSVEFRVDGDRKAPMQLIIGDGSASGTLSVDSGRICWGDTPIYCQDKWNGKVRVVWHPGSKENNVMPGYYVWLDDMLVGQGLKPHDAAENGCRFSVQKGKAKVVVSWADQAFAPTTKLRTSTEHAFIIK